MRKLLLAAMWLTPSVAFGQSSQPSDVRVDFRDVRICARAGCVAGGDALAAEIARALAAESGLTAATTAALLKAGGAMTGPLVLSGPPTLPLHPATKAYSDAETTRAQSAESANAIAIAGEASTARAAEGANATAIATEATTARNASNLSSGTVPTVRLPAISALSGYVDPTNAANITAGTLAAARLPAITTSTIGEGANLYFTTGRAAAAAPVQSVAGLAGAPTVAQVAAALGGTDGVHLAFGNDTRLCTGTAGLAAGCATLDANAKVLASTLTNRPAITPLTTTVTTGVTTVFNAGTFFSLRITLLTAGVQMACTGDGSTPVVGTSVTALGAGQAIVWLSQEGDAPPSGAVKCIASGTAAISVVAI